MGVCSCVHVCGRMCVHMCVCLRVRLCVCMCMCVHLCVRAHVCACLRVCTCMCCVHTRVRVCARTCICVHVCAGVCAPAPGAWGVVLVENRESEQVGQSRSSDALAADVGDRAQRPGNWVALVWIRLHWTSEPPFPIWERVALPGMGEG